VNKGGGFFGKFKGGPGNLQQFKGINQTFCKLKLARKRGVLVAQKGLGGRGVCQLVSQIVIQSVSHSFIRLFTHTRTQFQSY